MNNDLISRSELKKAVNDFFDNHFKGLVSNELITYAKAVDSAIDNAPTVFSCNACKNMGNERECVDCHDYSNYVHYEERPQDESISLEDGLKKARRGNYVIYDVDFLLDNLAREVNIMESARQWKAGKGNDND